MDWKMLLVDVVVWLCRAALIGFAYFCGFKMVEQVAGLRSQLIYLVAICCIIGAGACVYYQNYTADEAYPIQKGVGLAVAMIVVALQGHAIARRRAHKKQHP